MYRILLAATLGAILTAGNTSPLRSQDSPVAEIKPKKLELHGDVRIDNYYWLKQRDNAEVIGYLEAENEYLKAKLNSTEELQQQLFDETKARIKQTDVSVPVPDRGYEYYVRTEEGKQYSTFCRKRITGEQAEDRGDEEVLLDENKMAEGHDYFSVRGRQVSEDNRWLAFAVDTVGRRKYTLQIKDLETGQLLDDQIVDITGNLVWANDNQTLFYTRQDPKTLRSFQIFRHSVGDDPANDALVYQEDDEEFSCYVTKTRSKKFILIGTNQTVSSEFWYIDADTPHVKPVLLQKRERDHEYSVDHHGDHFYILTNWDATNFRIMKTPDDKTSKEHWTEVIAHREDTLLEDFELFDRFLVVDQRREGLTRFLIAPWKDLGAAEEMDFGEPCYVAGLSVIPEPDTDWLRYRISSPRTPPSTYEYQMATKERRLIKQQEVLGGFDRENYKTERRWATARDGTKVPISILYRVETAIDGTAPCLQYAYGSYGSSMDARFNSTIFNLVDRGFVYAIAHVRGGQEMGRQWYEQGKLLHKKNTFTDFIDCGEYLVAEKFADPKRIYARGGSAGGLLIGAVINMRPDLYDGVIADVPFVDVVTTMLDDSIPLTTSEYDEWGNPNDLKFYNYMLSYSPYDNVAEVDYPNMLVTTGLHDSQVQYWEPAKWVAKLRVRKTDDNLLVLKTNMGAGHGGASGRYERYKEVALRHAFLIYLANRK